MFCILFPLCRSKRVWNMVQPKWPFKRVNVHMHSLLNGCFMMGAMKKVWFKAVV